ncbi:RuvB ATP-dependent DNA helicase pontin [Lecanora helva]
MSFHRVLPIPPALSDQALRDRWAAKPDVLLSSKIMPDKTSNLEDTSSTESKLEEPASKSPPLSGDQGQSSREEEEELETYGSPKHTNRSLSLTPDARSRLPKTIEKPSSDETLDRWQGESPSSICLCQPDPKVPRPRNAFILYRQHNQAAVVQQNPGLANPEISKIIGDRWRNLSSEDKSHWKLLAEEEKIRHQKQYPDYRYQPRRSGRNNSVTTNSQPSSTEVSPRKCPKCGGHSIAASGMMSGSASFNPNTALGTPYSPSSKAMSTPSSGPHSGRFLQRLNLNSPPMTSAAPGQRGRPSTTTSTGAPLRLVSPPYSRRQEDRETSPRFKRPNNGQPLLRSPDSKRRRIANNVTYAPVRAANGPLTPFPFTAGGHGRRQSLPRPDFMGPGLISPITMGPPPRPHHAISQPTGPVTLAPIQASQPDKMEIDTQEKSLEAMILSIPTLGKIKVLSRISPPLAPPGPTSPVRQTRGIVIAIDASDPSAIKQLTKTLSTNLLEFSPRVFTTPTPHTDATPSFQAYLRLIDQYHTLSSQVISYITTLPSSSSNPITTISTSTENQKEKSETTPSPVSPKSFPRNSRKSSTNSSNPLPPISSSDDNTTDIGTGTIPVAIIPGFQVTWSDWFASHVPISDAYSPMDHWQWGATLWRNVVGADVVVAVQQQPPSPSFPPAAPAPASQPPSASEETNTASSSAGAGPPAKAGPGGGNKETKNKTSSTGASGNVGGGSGVEVRLEDARAVIVRGGEGGVGVPEGGLRRVGFEIAEWVRGWGEREERRGSVQG